jgi:hypothetical protein
MAFEVTITGIGDFLLQLTHRLDGKPAKAATANHHQIKEPEALPIDFSRAVIEQHLEEKSDSPTKSTTDRNGHQNPYATERLARIHFARIILHQES